MVKSNISAFVNTVLSMLFWAFSFVWVKEAYETFGPITTIFFRLIISSVLLLLFLKLINRLKPIEKQDYKSFLALAFFQPFLYFVSESYGLEMVSSTLAAVIVSTIPIFSSLFAFLFFKEKFSKLGVLGIILSFLGVGFLIFDKGFLLKAPILGVALMFVAVMSTIGYSLVLRKLVNKYSSVNIITYQNVIGIFMFLPLWLWLEADLFKTLEFKANSTMAIFELAIFASTIAFILYTKAIKTLGVSKTNMFINLIPVFTALFAWWVIDEALTMQKIIGISVVISGLFISQIKKHKNAT